MRPTGRTVTAGRPDFSSDPNRRRRFEIVPTKNTHGIEWLKLGSCRGIRHRGRKIEAFNTGVMVGRIQANNLGVARSRFRKEVVVGGKQVAQFHIFPIGITPWTQHVPLQIDGVFVVGRNWENMHFIPVADLKRTELVADGLSGACGRNIEAKHCALLMRFNSLHLDMA